MVRILLSLFFFVIMAAPCRLAAGDADPLAADAASAAYRTGVIDPRSTPLPAPLTARLKKAQDADLTALAAYLADGAADDYHKVKRFHDWMTDAIAYDTDKFLGLDDDGSNKPLEVLRLGRTTCGGFAALFVELCRRAGLEARVIKGMSRNYIGQNGSPSGHAWSAVKIGGRWYLVDVTADNRFGYYRDTFGTKRPYSDNSLFLHPRAKIMDNLPQRPEDQFLERTVTREEFLAAPKLYAGMLRYNATFITDLASLVTKVSEPRPGGRQAYIHDQVSIRGILRLELRVPDDVIVTCSIRDRDRKYDDEPGTDPGASPRSYPAHAFSFVEDDRRVCLFSAPGSGTYDAFIYAKREGQGGSRTLYSFRIKGDIPGEVLPPPGTWFTRRADAEALSGLKTGAPVSNGGGFARVEVKRPARLNLNAQLRTADDVYLKGRVLADLQDDRTLFHIAYPEAGEYRLRVTASDPQQTPATTLVLAEARVTATAAGELPPSGTLVRLPAFSVNGIRIIGEDVTAGCRNGLCTVVATAPDGVELTGSLKSPAGKNASADVAAGKEGDRWRFFFRVPDASGSWVASLGVRDAAGKISSAARFRLPPAAAPAGPLLPPRTLLLHGAFFRAGGTVVSQELVPRDGTYRFALRAPAGYRVRCSVADREGKAVAKAATVVGVDGLWNITITPPDPSGVTGRVILVDPAGKGTTAGSLRLE